MKNSYTWLGALLLCAIFTLFVGDFPWKEAWEGVFSRLSGSSTTWNPILDERIPRLIVIICTGASLAVSGATLQSLFQNPLASPNILGISIGGALLTTFAFVMQWHVSYPFAIPLVSFMGCLLTLLLIYNISKASEPHFMGQLVLTGIAISTLFLAIQGAILFAFRDNWQLMQMITEWEVGTTSDRSWKHVHMQLPVTLVGLWGCWHYRKEVNLLSLGSEEATNFGVDVKKVRFRLFLCVALLTGGAIAAVGTIAFLGLALPHLVRKLYGQDHSLLIPFCILGGAITLSATDLTLRYFQFQALSLGNLCAIFGATFFLYLLLKKESYARN